MASFAVKSEDQIILVTDLGQLIRIPVHDIRIAGRNTQGVTLFKTDKSEKVVSVIRLGDESEIDNVDETGIPTNSDSVNTGQSGRDIGDEA